MTIEHLPGTRLTPTVVLARQLEDADALGAVIVLTQDGDGRWDMDWSQMPLEKIATALVYMQHRVQGIIVGTDEEAETVQGGTP